MTDLQKQIVVTADSSGVAAGLEPGKKSLQSLGATAVSAGKQASDAIASVGDGGGAAAQKVDRATQSIIGSIQRTTAVLEAGSKTSSKYFETLANQRGIDATALTPYLQALDSANAKQHAAADSMDHLNFSTVGARRELIVLGHELSQGNWSKFGGSLLVLGEKTDALGAIFSATGISIAAAAVAVGGLAAAFVLGAKESENYARAIILSGNAAGVTVSQLQGQAEAISKSLGVTRGAAAESLAEFVTNGNVVGNQLQRISGIAVQYQKETGQAIGDTVKQFAELGKDPLAASIKLNEQYHYLTLSVYQQIKALEDSGQAAKAAETAQKAFADSMETRAAALKGNLGLIEQAWRGITGAAKSAWDEMLGLGRKQSIPEQIKAAQDELQKRLDHGPLNNATAQTGSFEKGNQALRDRITALSEIQGMEATDATFQAQSVARTQARVKFDADGVQFLSKQAQLNREITKAQQEGAAAGATQAEIATRIAGIRKKYDTGGPDRSIQAEFQKRIDEANAELNSTKQLDEAEKFRVDGIAKINAALKAKSITTQQAAADEKLLQIAYAKTLAVEQQRGDKTFDKALQSIDEQLDAQQREIDGEEKLTKVQIEARQLLKDLADGHLKLTDAQAAERIATLGLSVARDKLQQQELRDKKQFAEDAFDSATYLYELQQQAGALKDRSFALDQANSFLLISAGSTETLEMATLRLAAADLRSAAARKEAAFGANAYSDQLRANAADIEKLIGKLQQNIDLTAWRNAVNQYNDIFKEGFRTALGAGTQSFSQWAKVLAHTFETTVIDEIYKQLAQPFVVSIVGNVLGLVGLGGAAVASAATSPLQTAGNVAGVANGVNTLSTFGAVGAGGATFAAGLKAGFSSLTGEAGVSGALSAGTASLEAGNIAAGLGTIAGSLGPIALGIGALVSLFHGNGGTPTSSTGDSNASFDRTGSITSKNVFGQTSWTPTPSANSEAIVAGLEQTYLTAATNLGIKAAATNFSYSGNTGKDGKNPNFGLGGAAGSSSFYQSETALTDDAVKLASSRAVLAALEGSDLPKYLQDVFDGLTPSTATQAQIDATLAQAQSIADFHKALDALPFDYLKTLSYDAAKGLIAAAGGVQTFSANLSTYYNDFATDEEKRAATIANITSTLKNAGANISADDVAHATRDQFKAAVTAAGQNLGTAAGQALYAALLSVAGAFNDLVPAAINASAATDAAAQALADAATAQKSWQEKIDLLTGKTTQRQLDLAHDLAGTTDETTQALIRQYYAQLDLQDAATAAAAAIQTAADSSKAAVAAANQALADARSSSDAAVSAALSGVSRAVDAAKAQLTTSFNANDAALAAQITAANQTISDLQNFSNTLHGTLTTLAGQLADPINARAAAQATVQDALGVARAGGNANSIPGLQDALNTLTKANPADYASKVAYLRDVGQTKASVQELANLTDSGLTIAERQLQATQKTRDDAKTAFDAQIAALDNQYKLAQEQVDLLNGIDDSVKSVSDAIAALASAISGRQALSPEANVASTFSSFIAANGGKGNVSSYEPGQIAGLSTAEAARQELAGVYGAAYNGAAQFASTNYLDPAKLAAFAPQIAAITDYFSHLTVAQRGALDHGTLTFAKALGIPGFDIGINRVPADMLALVHKDERILPAADNRELFARLRDPQAGNAALLSELQAQRDQNAQLSAQVQALLERVARNTRDTYKQLDAVAHGADSWQQRSPDV